MDKQDAKRVKAWLYSIAKTEQAITNLEYAIEDMRAKLDNPPSYIVTGISNYSGMTFSGGEEGGSKGYSYATWQDTTTSRLRYLQDSLKASRRKVEQYQQTLDALKMEPKWGYDAGEIIRKKYHDKVWPDKAIYAIFLFISPEWFYKLHRRGLQYFFDVLPDVFAKEKSTV